MVFPKSDKKIIPSEDGCNSHSCNKKGYCDCDLTPESEFTNEPSYIWWPDGGPDRVDARWARWASDRLAHFEEKERESEFDRDSVVETETRCGTQVLMGKDADYPGLASRFCLYTEVSQPISLMRVRGALVSFGIATEGLRQIRISPNLVMFEWSDSSIKIPLEFLTRAMEYIFLK